MNAKKVKSKSACWPANSRKRRRNFRFLAGECSKHSRRRHAVHDYYPPADRALRRNSEYPPSVVITLKLIDDPGK